MQFSHGRWRSDPVRHRTTLHIAMHFFLPGVLWLSSLLGSWLALPAGRSVRRTSVVVDRLADEAGGSRVGGGQYAGREAQREQPVSGQTLEPVAVEQRSQI